MTGQLAMRVEHPAGTLPLIVRASTDRRVLRAECDWTRSGPGWVSSNGWTVRRAHVGSDADGWAAFAPDGIPEWWASDPVTAMTRAEGGS